jgi:hypothetical protein
MKRSNSKFRVPKYQTGGFLGAFGKGTDALGSGMPGKGYTDEEAFNLQTYGQNIMKSKKAEQTGQQVENVVGQLGPWGKAIAGVSKIAGKAFGPDAYGDYDDTAGGKAKNFFNRSLNMQEGVAGLMDTFKRPTAGNIKSQLTLGLWGKSEREKDAEQFKRDIQTRKTNDMLSQNSQLGAMVKSSLPTFKAPAYGQDGLKLPKPDVKLPSDFQSKGDYENWYKGVYGSSQYATMPQPVMNNVPSLKDPFKLKQFKKGPVAQPAQQMPDPGFTDMLKMAPAQFSDAFKSMFKTGGKIKSKSKFNRA